MLGLLSRIEQSPTGSFAEQDLLANCEAEFDEFRRLGLLRTEELPSGSFACVVDGRPYIVRRDGSDYIAIEMHEPQPAIRRLAEQQVRRWRADIPALVRVMQRENQLLGPEEAISGRLWYVGRSVDEVAVLLGLYRNSGDLENEIKTLPSRFPNGVGRFLVVCPTMRVTPLLEARLTKQHINIVNPEASDGLRIASLSASRQVDETNFIFSNDYKAITIRGKDFRLSERRAKVVMILHRARKMGQKELAWQTIKSQLEAPPNAFFVERMQDIFKGLPDWNLLIKRTATGYFALNL